jgi:cell division protein FtsB
VTSRARVLIAAVLFIGFLFGAVFPTRTYLDQRKEIDAAEARLSLFQKQNGVMEAEVARLQNDHEIERIARERFNLVKPGEEAYAVVPLPAPASAEKTPAPEEDKPGPVLAWVRNTLKLVF